MIYYYQEILGDRFINGYKIPDRLIFQFPPIKDPQIILRESIKESQYVDFEEVKDDYKGMDKVFVQEEISSIKDKVKTMLEM